MIYLFIYLFTLLSLFVVVDTLKTVQLYNGQFYHVY